MTPPPSAPSCTIAGLSSVTTTDNPTYTITSSTNANSTEIWKSPTGNQSWTNICSSSGNCSGTTQFACPGTYWAVCNAYSGAIGTSPKCSGNPWPLPSGWTDCGSSSRMQVISRLACPSGFNVSCNTAGTQATISWNALSCAVGYVLRVNKDPQNEWFSTGDIWEEPVSPSQTIDITPGSNYVYDVQGKASGESYPYAGDRCPFETFQCAAPPSCTVDLIPASASVTVGAETPFIASVSNIQNGTVSQVNFSSLDTSIASVFPASDTTPEDNYLTKATGVGIGSTTIRSGVIMSGAERCFDTSTITVTPPGPWWQVRDSDVRAGGDLRSPIPASCTLPACNPVFGLKGAGGYPGVPMYGGSVADFQAGLGTGQAAEDPNNWLANTDYAGQTYDYDYFVRQIPSDVTINELTPPVTGGTFNSGGSPSRGYVWYHWNGATLGDLTINGNVNLVGSRRVVLLVERANVLINGRIRLQSPGQGFFMMVVGEDANGLKGDILVDPSVTNIEGIFLAENEFKTGVASTQFNARGSVVAYEGVSLDRDLGVSNVSTPAETFEYAPELMLVFPQVFSTRSMRWKEVAP